MAGTILHFGAIRLRVTGNGNLRHTMYSMDKVSNSVLVPLVMSSTSARDLTRLSNTMQEYIILRGETTAINEIFKINRITIYSKPVYSSFPA